MAQNQPDEDRLIDDHGLRIRDLEGNFTRVSSQLAAQSVQIDGLGRTIDTGIQTLVKKFDGFATPIASQLESVAGVVDEHATYLKTFREAEKARTDVKAERRKFWKNIATGILIASGGVVLKELSVWLWGPIGAGHYLLHFFRH